jgi:hypothetical protein
MRQALLALLLAACTSPAPDHGNQDDGRKEIGPNGGSISLPGGSSLDIPPGALSGSQTISIESADGARAHAPASLKVVGPMVRLGPEGPQFAAPVTVTLGFDPSLVPNGAQVVVFTAPAMTDRAAP